MDDRLNDQLSGEDETRRKSGQFLFALLFLGLSVLLLALIGEQTKWVARTKLYTQPAFWPAVSLSGMVLFTALHIRQHHWRRLKPADRLEGRIWLRPFEYAFYFMLYVTMVPIIGFLPISMIFAPLMLYRFGYRKRLQLWVGVVFAIAVVVLFKGLLGVKIPGSVVYEYLPGAMRSFFILNF
ncbi:MAG: tripartite tricarboxylate transporter TctB family protein [Rhizobiaceae bacterium]